MSHSPAAPRRNERNDSPTIVIIAAVAENGAIGAGNRLPWHLPADLKRFRRLTTGHPVIMGRRNFESIGRPLPDRTNIVVTRNPKFSAPGCLTAGSLAEALRIAVGEKIYIIGGAQIYREALPLASTMELTWVHTKVAGDVYFPPYDAAEWREVAREEHKADERHAFAYSFVTLRRKTGSDA